MIGRGAAVGDARGGLLNAGEGGVGFGEGFFEGHAAPYTTLFHASSSFCGKAKFIRQSLFNGTVPFASTLFQSTFITTGGLARSFALSALTLLQFSRNSTTVRGRSLFGTPKHRNAE